MFVVRGMRYKIVVRVNNLVFQVSFCKRYVSDTNPITFEKIIYRSIVEMIDTIR